ncbi:mannose-6-phosphate isomerase, partial [Erysipelatoclostridium ramosum]|nr:mannose-6-phosphate isomerase [Thomasclavelia ramosa]
VHKEERTGLCELQFLECRRIWMTGKTTHCTDGETNALNLISGKEALIESPEGQFAPFIIHFAESVCIPATIRSYTITPYGESEGKEVAIMKTFVRF